MRETLSRLFATALMSAALLWPAQPALAQFSQLGNKLVVTGTGCENLNEGTAVALSGDGTTAAIVGESGYIFRRHHASWTQKSFATECGTGNSVALSADGYYWIEGFPRDDWAEVGGRCETVSRYYGTLQGTPEIGYASQGQSVALSADGNTAIVGGNNDNSGIGAAWVFACSGGVWTQQAKLVGSGPIGEANQGISVALSGDGNTAIVGGVGDNNSAGAAWVFTRSGGAWSQQGAKLVGTGAVGAEGAHQGASVALSADGNTAILGGTGDNNFAGAAWVFTRSGGAWSQQGAKLVGSGAPGNAVQGFSVALSADGNTAIVGGPTDNSLGVGAAWAFTRSGGTWSQLGSTLVGTGAVGASRQGWSVALSADGNIAMVGGPSDNNNQGAVWVFYQSIGKLNAAATHNFAGGGYSSIAWRQSAGATAIWLMVNASVALAENFGAVPANWQIVGQRDFNNDGIYDLLWRDGASGTVAIWEPNGLQTFVSGSLGAVPLNWSVAGTSDFNYDGRGDILWRDTSSGTVAIWLLNGLSVQQSGSLGAVPLNWTIAATDGKGNIFWRDSNTGTLAIWEVYGFQVLQIASLGAVPLNWTIVGVGDFDGNGSTDILWRDGNTGTLAIWLLNGFSILQTGSLGTVPSNWIVAETGDFNGDYNSDILWRDTSAGTVAIWFMNGLQVSSSATVATVGLDWTIQGLNAD